MKKISGYELSVTFDTDGELSVEESDELLDKVMELFEDSEIVSLRLSPIDEDCETEDQE